MTNIHSKQILIPCMYTLNLAMVCSAHQLRDINYKALLFFSALMLKTKMVLGIGYFVLLNYTFNVI